MICKKTKWETSSQSENFSLTHSYEVYRLNLSPMIENHVARRKNHSHVLTSLISSQSPFPFLHAAFTSFLSSAKRMRGRKVERRKSRAISFIKSLEIFGAKKKGEREREISMRQQSRTYFIFSEKKRKKRKRILSRRPEGRNSFYFGKIVARKSLVEQSAR